MGLGDFLEGAGKGLWHGYEHVSGAAWNMAKPLVDSGVYWAKNTSPVYNLVTGGEGYDQVATDATTIGKGTAKGTKFVVEHPKESAQIAKTVGWEVLKQQATPENIAINTALLASTVASGGATAPAWMARLGLTTKGLETVRGVEVGTDVVRGAEVGVDTARAAEAASATSKAAEFSAPAINASRLERFSAANQSTYAGFQEARGFGKVDAALDAPRQYMMNAREALGMGRQGALTEARTGLANRLFPSVAEGEATGMGGALAKHGYRTVAGGAGLPEAGARSVVSDMTWRAATTAKRTNQITNFGDNVKTFDQIAHGIADPEWAARQVAKKGTKKGLQVAKEHKGEITEFATTQAKKRGVDTIADQIKDKLFGDDDEQKEVKGNYVKPPDLPMTTGLGQLSTSEGFVAPRKTSAAGTKSLVTVQGPAEAQQIGPSHWYDESKSSYASGRGFRSPASQSAWGSAV